MRYKSPGAKYYSRVNKLGSVLGLPNLPLREGSGSAFAAHMTMTLGNLGSSEKFIKKFS